MAIDFNSVQCWKAYLSILVTELGMIIDEILEYLKASSPMVVTVLGIVEEAHPRMRVLVAVLMMALQLLRESNVVLPDATLMEVSPEHPKNAWSAI